jgi:CubicO group peptidase (beta-lactamase class C family)
MIKNLVLSLAFLIPFSVSAQKESKDIAQFVNELDQKMPQLLNDFIVPGAAIAIIENGEIILQKGYGFSDIEKRVKVTSETGFNIGSISKTVAAWGVMKLVQEGKIDLDASAEKYLSRWHLPKSDFNSNEVTIRRLLSHTAGLSLHGYPGWSPKDKLPTIEESLNGKNNGPGRVEIIMEPGTKWKYSGGGYSILQLIIEEVTKQKFEDYIQTQILNPLGMSNSSYTIDEKIMKTSSLEYNNFGEEIDFELFTAQAAAGLHTTIEDFVRFAQASCYQDKNNEKYNKVLTTDVIQQMMEPATASEGSYGLGYQVDSIPGTSMVLRGHGGANTGWHATFSVDPVSNDGFVMVTNGGAGHNIYRRVFCDWVYWKTGKSLGNRCQIKLPISSKLKNIIDSKDIVEIAATYAELKKNESEKYNFSENQLNQLGYYYLGKDKLEVAIALLKINVDAFPNSFNTYDSYGEALLKSGDKEKAIENYSTSVKLNPGNEYGIKVLKELGVDTDALITKYPIEYLNSFTKKYKEQAIHRLSQLMNDFYVFPEVAKQTEEHLMAQWKEGHFDSFENDETFAAALTESVQAINKDKHMRITANRPYVAPENSPERMLEERLGRINRSRNSNSGFSTVRILEGNVGYLDLRGFAGLESGKAIADAYMKLMARTDAVIIDLSKNGGGSPSMVQYLCSYFFDQKLHLNSLYYRAGNETREFWTLDEVGGIKMPDVPLFVITSEKTFSGAEEFSYNMQTQKRATLVGQTTGGGANPGGTRGINENLSVFIPTGKAINPITKTNWEGVGVIPEIETSVEEALDKTHELAKKAAEGYRTKTKERYNKLFLDLQSKLDHYTAGKSEASILQGLTQCRDAKLFGEGDINMLGYEYLMEHKKPKIAESIFRANTMLSPNSANVFDSYGESLMINGNLKASLKQYQRAVELATENKDRDIELFKKNLENVKRLMGE